MMHKVKDKWQALNRSCPKGYGFGEVLSVIVLYFFSVRLFVTQTPGLRPYAGLLENAREQVATSFTKGAIIQLVFLAVMVFVFKSRFTRQALKSLARKAPSRGWGIALVIVLIDVVVVTAGWIDDPGRMLSLTPFALSMALVPALDGLTQEVVFRGYLLRRLEAAGFNRRIQILLSGLAFGALHFNYGGGGESLGQMAIPALGTFGLGAALAFACQQSSYRLGPVVAAHVLIIFILQPWLALSSLG